MSKPKPNWLTEAAEFIRSEGIAVVLFGLLFSPALILALLVHVIIRAWENHQDGPNRRPEHVSASVLLIPYLVLPVLMLVWAVALVIALVTIFKRLLLMH